MNQTKLEELAQYLNQHSFEIELALMIVGGIAAILLAVFLVRAVLNNRTTIEPAAPRARPPAAPTPKKAAAADSAPKATAPQPAPSTPVRAPVATPVAPVAAAVTATPVVVTAAPKRPHIPQESVLRRHYLTHIRYMIEATTFPRPTESVLRRHYEQLVSSIFDACVEDAAELDKLLHRYDEHLKQAYAAQAK